MHHFIDNSTRVIDPLTTYRWNTSFRIYILLDCRAYCPDLNSQVPTSQLSIHNLAQCGIPFSHWLQAFGILVHFQKYIVIIRKLTIYKTYLYVRETRHNWTILNCRFVSSVPFSIIRSKLWLCLNCPHSWDNWFTSLGQLKQYFDSIASLVLIIIKNNYLIHSSTKIMNISIVTFSEKTIPYFLLII